MNTPHRTKYSQNFLTSQYKSHFCYLNFHPAGDDGKVATRERKVDLPFVIKSATECQYTQPGIVQIGESNVVVTLNFDTPLVSEMLEKGSLNSEFKTDFKNDVTFCLKLFNITKDITTGSR